MTETPIMLLDVDGVLNTFTYANPLIHNDYLAFEAGNGFTITWSPSLLKRITDLHHSGAIEVRWLTTWQNDANTLLRKTFGFSEDLVVEGGETDQDVFHWWKLPVARDAVENNERVIWIDDDIRHSSAAMTWANIMDRNELLVISPIVCLEHKHLDQIEEWISK